MDSHLLPSASDEPTQLVVRLVRIAKLARNYVRVHLASIGVENGQDEFLLALNEGRPITIGALAAYLGIRRSTASKMSDGLIECGWVRRARSRQDKRIVFLEITPSGLIVQREIQRVWQTMERDLLGSVKESERNELCASLQMGREVLEARLARRR